jgi:hypothetical protein
LQRQELLNAAGEGVGEAQGHRRGSEPLPGNVSACAVAMCQTPPSSRLGLSWRGLVSPGLSG